MTDHTNQETRPPERPREDVGTRLLFENDRVRVWDLALAPGEWLETHVHRTDYLFVVIQGGHLRHADPANPSEAHEVTYTDDQVVFLDVPPAGVVHQRLTNLGDAPYRNLVIELKPQGAEAMVCPAAP